MRPALIGAKPWWRSGDGARAAFIRQPPWSARRMLPTDPRGGLRRRSGDRPTSSRRRRTRLGVDDGDPKAPRIALDGDDIRPRAHVFGRERRRTADLLAGHERPNLLDAARRDSRPPPGPPRDRRALPPLPDSASSGRWSSPGATSARMSATSSRAPRRRGRPSARRGRAATAGRRSRARTAPGASGRPRASRRADRRGPRCRVSASVIAVGQRIGIVARGQLDELAHAQLRRQPDFLHHDADMPPAVGIERRAAEQP